MTRGSGKMGVGLLCAVAFLAPLSCQTVQKATGTRMALMQGTPDRVVQAAETALKELKLTVYTAESSKVDGQIKAETAQGKGITVNVHREGDSHSRMTVKVGHLGDKSISQAIIAETRKRLEQSP